MRPYQFLTAALLLTATPGLTCAAAGELADTVDAIKPSMVAIGTMQYSRRPAGEFRGTGFAVSDGHHVATSAHVVPDQLDTVGGEFLAVFVGSGSRVEARRGSVVKLDRRHDLALIRFDGPALAPLDLSFRRVREGELYAFTGFPLGALLGMYPVTHTGIISSITPVLASAGDSLPLDPSKARRHRSKSNVYQIDATAYPGNSGSPLYHPDTGHVVGVINKVYVRDATSPATQEVPSGLTYAVPVEHLGKLIPEARR